MRSLIWFENKCVETQFFFSLAGAFIKQLFDFKRKAVSAELKTFVYVF